MVKKSGVFREIIFMAVKKNMLNEKLRNRIINVVSLLMAYSVTVLWRLIYDCMCFYLWDKAGIRLRGGVGIVLLTRWLFRLITALPIIITVLKRKSAKIIIMVVYLIYSSFRLLPEYPCRWLYFSVGTTVFFYVIDNLITFWKMKNSLKEILINYVLVILMCVFLIAIAFFFWDKTIEEFLLKPVVLGNVIVAAASFAYYALRDKMRDAADAKREAELADEK